MKKAIISIIFSLLFFDFHVYFSDDETFIVNAVLAASSVTSSLPPFVDNPDKDHHSVSSLSATSNEIPTSQSSTINSNPNEASKQEDEEHIDFSTSSDATALDADGTAENTDPLITEKIEEERLLSTQNSKQEDQQPDSTTTTPASSASSSLPEFKFDYSKSTKVFPEDPTTWTAEDILLYQMRNFEIAMLYLEFNKVSTRYFAVHQKNANGLEKVTFIEQVVDFRSKYGYLFKDVEVTVTSKENYMKQHEDLEKQILMDLQEFKKFDFLHIKNQGEIFNRIGLNVKHINTLQEMAVLELEFQHWRQSPQDDDDDDREIDEEDKYPKYLHEMNFLTQELQYLITTLKRCRNSMIVLNDPQAWSRQITNQESQLREDYIIFVKKLESIRQLIANEPPTVGEFKIEEKNSAMMDVVIGPWNLKHVSVREVSDIHPIATFRTVYFYLKKLLSDMDIIKFKEDDHTSDTTDSNVNNNVITNNCLLRAIAVGAEMEESDVDFLHIILKKSLKYWSIQDVPEDFPEDVKKELKLFVQDEALRHNFGKWPDIMTILAISRSISRNFVIANDSSAGYTLVKGFDGNEKKQLPYIFLKKTKSCYELYKPYYFG